MTIFLKSSLGALMLCGKLVLIVVPLVVIFEVLRCFGLGRSAGQTVEAARRINPHGGLTFADKS